MSEPEDYSTWTLKKAEPGPSEYDSWELRPAPKYKPAPKPTLGQALLRGGAQGATLGFADESAGTGALLGSLYGKYAPELAGGAPSQYAKDIHPLDSYRQARDEYRAEDEATKKEHGGAFLAAELAGSVPTALLSPFRIAKGAGWLSTLAKAGAVGGISGLGSSNADLTSGDVADIGRAALDTGVGAGVGMLAGAAGKRLSGFANKASDEVRLANADQALKTAQAAQAADRSAISAVGGETAAALKNFENTMKVAENAGGVHGADVVAAAKAKLLDPKYLDVVRKAGENAVKIGPDRLGGSLATAEAVRAGTLAAKEPEAIEKAAEAAMSNPLRRQVLPRLMNYGQRAIPGILGYQHGGIPGAIGGALVGSVMGSPGTAFANMVKNPGVRRMMWSALQPIGTGLSYTAKGAAPGAPLELAPDVAARIAALRKRPEPDYSTWTLLEGQ